MNESFVTIMGNVVGDPQGRSTKAGKPFASFRVASTVRRWDSEQRRFVDGSTNFVNVVGFNALGGNIMASLHKGTRSWSMGGSGSTSMSRPTGRT